MFSCMVIFYTHLLNVHRNFAYVTIQNAISGCNMFIKSIQNYKTKYFKILSNMKAIVIIFSLILKIKEPTKNNHVYILYCLISAYSLQFVSLFILL